VSDETSSGEARSERRSVRAEAEQLRAASDGTLVLAIARYHQEALAEAFRRHAGSVHGLARRLLRDDALAEEIVQEVFTRLWDTPERFDPDRGSLRAYLLAQTHGRAVDLVRAETARRNREEREERKIAKAGPDVEGEVWDLHVSEQVRDALGGLREEERGPIVLAYFGGYTYRQVAEVLDQPEGTVKSRIRSGLARLRGELLDAGIGGDPWPGR
jgi:RNA polymerase sigma-70 factor, ECF subfamily